MEPDWALWRSFEAVVAEGSLSGAARRLGLSQPTIGRHIDALERALGVVLFERRLQGFKPTETALRLAEPVAAARQALAFARNMAEGASESPVGSVRITASEVFSHYILPAMLRRLREEHPRIALEIVPSDSAENLLLREADIAIRMFRPTQLDLISRHIGDLSLTCCAHEDYLARRGRPVDMMALSGHDLIGLDRSDLILRGARALGAELRREDFMLRSDSQTLGWEMLKSGLGIGFAQRVLVEGTPGMVSLLPEIRIAPLGVWLTTHKELFTSRRIRVIYAALATMLAHYIAAAPKGAAQQS